MPEEDKAVWEGVTLADRHSDKPLNFEEVLMRQVNIALDALNARDQLKSHASIRALESVLSGYGFDKKYLKAKAEAVTPKPKVTDSKDLKAMIARSNIDLAESHRLFATLIQFMGRKNLLPKMGVIDSF